MKVEKNIPIPKTFPFDKMGVGDSFAVPSHIHRTAVSVAAMRYGVKHDRKFTVRQMPDRTYRCWRIA